MPPPFEATPGYREEEERARWSNSKPPEREEEAASKLNSFAVCGFVCDLADHRTGNAQVRQFAGCQFVELGVGRAVDLALRGCVNQLRTESGQTAEERGGSRESFSQDGHFSFIVSSDARPSPLL